MGAHSRILASVCLVWLVGVLLFTPSKVPMVPAPAVESEAADISSLQERLALESMVYAFEQVAQADHAKACKIVSLVLRESDRYTDIDPTLTLGLIVVESMGQPELISSAGARGLMQVMPETGRFIALRFQERWVDAKHLHDEERNIRYGIWYLDYLQGEFPNNQLAALAAYNWGPGRMKYRIEQNRVLPQVYPSKVWAATKRLQEKAYEHYELRFWDSLNLSGNQENFYRCPIRSNNRQ